MPLGRNDEVIKLISRVSPPADECKFLVSEREFLAQSRANEIPIVDARNYIRS